jgi:TfoX/Sxy family transcriptional regulator of competence genes
MLISDSEVVTSQGIAELLASALAPIGDISLEPRLQGVALLDDGVMFGYVDATGTPYLRATAMSAPRFHALGSTKHPEMQYPGCENSPLTLPTQRTWRSLSISTRSHRCGCQDQCRCARSCAWLCLLSSVAWLASSAP